MSHLPRMAARRCIQRPSDSHYPAFLVNSLSVPVGYPPSAIETLGDARGTRGHRFIFGMMVKCLAPRCHPRLFKAFPHPQPPQLPDSTIKFPNYPLTTTSPLNLTARLAVLTFPLAVAEAYIFVISFVSLEVLKFCGHRRVASSDDHTWQLL